jgi:hypothetical protein
MGNLDELPEFRACSLYSPHAGYWHRSVYVPILKRKTAQESAF